MDGQTEGIKTVILKKADLSFFIPWAVFIIIGPILLVYQTQKEIFFAVNTHNTPWLDAIMPYCTDIGDGATAAVIGVLLMVFTRIRHGLAFSLACAMEGVIVQVLKIYIFTGKLRPWAFFKADNHIHLIKDFVPYTNNSFPSGHTATAFCMAAMASLIWPKQKLGWLFFCIAALVAYSRIYLSQHYFIDVFAGTVIGTLSALIVQYFIYRPNQGILKRLHRLDQPLIRFKR